MDLFLTLFSPVFGKFKSFYTQPKIMLNVFKEDRIAYILDTVTGHAVSTYIEDMRLKITP